jgi:hypothetical protein
MLKGACPSCGGEVLFRSKTSILCVCTYCRSNIVRHDVNLELIGKQSELLEDMSPLQIGVTGKYYNRNFQIIGRQILSWSGGRWNEWYIAFSDGTDGWLAEAQGEFSVLLTPEKTPALPSASKLSHMNQLIIGELQYKLADKKEVHCLGSEGELPFKTVEGSKSVVYDYTHHSNGFASIEVSEDSSLHLYVGEFKSLGSLKVSGIRRFEGWGKP